MGASQDFELDVWSEEDFLATELLIQQADLVLLSRSRAGSLQAVPCQDTNVDEATIQPHIRRPADACEQASATKKQQSSFALPAAVTAHVSAAKEDAATANEGASSAAALPKESSSAHAAQHASQQGLPDLEDIGLVLDRRRFRQTGMSVTDFTEAEWCQQQFALALTVQLPKVDCSWMLLVRTCCLMSCHLKLYVS
jgi:hypothetical protein